MHSRSAHNSSREPLPPPPPLSLSLSLSLVSLSLSFSLCLALALALALAWALSLTLLLSLLSLTLLSLSLSLPLSISPLSLYLSSLSLSPLSLSHRHTHTLTHTHTHAHKHTHTHTHHSGARSGWRASHTPRGAVCMRPSEPKRPARRHGAALTLLWAAISTPPWHGNKRSCYRRGGAALPVPNVPSWRLGTLAQSLERAALARCGRGRPLCPPARSTPRALSRPPVSAPFSR